MTVDALVTEVALPTRYHDDYVAADELRLVGRRGGLASLLTLRSAHCISASTLQPSWT